MQNKKPLISIIILTHNGLELTKRCISSILQHTKENYEFVFIDNHSQDETVEFLQTIPNKKLMVNKENMGFAQGCNDGFTIAEGDYFVLINNDTIVTKNWLSNLIWWLEKDGEIGIVGPRSNFVMPKQMIHNITYKTLDDLNNFAEERERIYFRQGFQVDVLSGLCMAFRRELIEQIGGFDHRYFPGYYEDNDFSIRTQIYGKKLWVTNDVFIHHYGGE
ncbi:glycosyltransferase family 2 protein [Bacillus carboniphilus]|uniref:Glycosyltransferase family 2 protein n=1 Tax=Bacillus carboniphilus TaxID=86663 RepID=A0ABY9K2C5_9BACI|nr:glycosyltransferase family 2 protein [Bacillus carboniphilus]WLR44056.1 glycosyltransferase family 2 protein [Bacillus carboniphilus]